MYGQPEQTAVAAPEQTGLSSTNPVSPSLVVRETHARGRGVFASLRLAEGEIAIVGKPVAISPERTWQTLQTDTETHIKIDAPFELVNHSCDPSCGIVTNKYGGYTLVARRNIETGEEITFDYCMTEWSIVGFEDCQCNSGICRRIIRGGKFLSVEKLKEYDGYLAPYYRSLLPELGDGS